MRLASVQRQEPTEAAHIGRGQRQVGVAAAQLRRQQIQGQVMAANDDNRPFEALRCAQ